MQDAMQWIRLTVKISILPCTPSLGCTPGLGSGKSHPDECYVSGFINRVHFLNWRLGTN